MGKRTLTTETMGELLSELLEGGESEDPWAPALIGRESRVRAYRNLAAKLGPRYERATFENYEIYEQSAKGERMSQAECVERVERFCNDMPDRLQHGGGLVFFGRPGTGKDHLMAACMYWAILKHGWRVLWIDGLTLAERIRGRVGNGEDEASFLNAFLEPQILAISDPIPPKGETSVYVADTLQRIVDRRYRACLSTWATINVHDGREAEQRLAAPVVDRLRHGSLCLQCEWESFRKRQA